ncbi:acyltransferase [Chitinophaga agrisoli]|uniref:Acyltransferase n=1 Tax=Chitinophaga agrisoli TaxID=2607653 RepID=A0A5B2W473_9BACT|nr:acyltransferase [Chitinophaga agrisoli]KAA2245356.1 acyltransferase [Chitinophaga agrisoli]
MLRSLLYSLDARLNYWLGKGRFRYLGGKVRIICPLRITGHNNISLGNQVIINYKTWLAAQPLTGMPDCLLEIGDGSVIGNFNHIYATHSIKIGKNVLTADKVYISDNLHQYIDIHVPVMHQPVIQNRTVAIGDGTWLGENVCVLGAHIGKQSVIGANSVVINDIPDYCVAVGAPAKIIKRYCLKESAWKKTTPDGAFVE